MFGKLFDAKNKKASRILALFQEDVSRATEADIGRVLHGEGGTISIDNVQGRIAEYLINESKNQKSTNRAIGGLALFASGAAFILNDIAVRDFDRVTTKIADTATAIQARGGAALFEYATKAAEHAHPIMSALSSDGAIYVAIGLLAAAIVIPLGRINAKIGDDRRNAEGMANEVLATSRETVEHVRSSVSRVRHRPSLFGAGRPIDEDQTMISSGHRASEQAPEVVEKGPDNYWMP